MSNTRKAKPKTYKFSTFQKEAEKKRQANPNSRPEIPPFVIDDVTPPIIITAPDTVERQLVIAELVGRDGVPDVTQSLPLLRAMCGDQFGRVWALVKNDKDPNVLLTIIQTLFDHFSDVLETAVEAEELPGGSGDSSN